MLIDMIKELKNPLWEKRREYSHATDQLTLDISGIHDVIRMLKTAKEEDLPDIQSSLHENIAKAVEDRLIVLKLSREIDDCMKAVSALKKASDRQ